jgi:hypothetical protein
MWSRQIWNHLHSKFFIVNERDRERDSMQRCQIKQDFKVAKKLKHQTSKIYKSEGGGAVERIDTCKVWVAQLVINKSFEPKYYRHDLCE